jgi:hypothetical protein
MDNIYSTINNTNMQQMNGHISYGNMGMQNNNGGFQAYRTDNIYNPLSYGANYNTNSVGTINNSTDSYNFNLAYKNNKPVNFNGNNPTANFDNYEFKNRNNIMHNNLDKNILIGENEMIREIPIYIDSKDRDIVTYPSPFSFKVNFQPLSSNERTSGVKPYIPTSFQNVKYIKLERAILPYHYRSKVENGVTMVDDSKKLTDNMYLIMDIKELSGNNENATNDSVGKSFDLLYYDQCITKNNKYYYAITDFNKVFPRDKLLNLDRMTININNYFGTQIKTNFDTYKGTDSTLLSYQCICNIDSNSTKTSDESKCPIHYPKHPLYPEFQTHFTFKIGIYEPHFNKLIYS